MASSVTVFIWRMDSPISMPLAISAQLVKDGNTVLNAVLKSAYEVKNNSCLFERLLQSKEERCFPFWDIFFRFRDIYVFVLCK